MTRLFRLLFPILLGQILPAILPGATDLPEIDALIEEQVEKKIIPGAVLHIERFGSPPFQKAYGARALLPKEEKNTVDTLYDTASLTKVLVTAPAILQLAEQKLLNLEETVFRHIPEFKGDSREAITIHHLLTHTSGLPPGLPLGNDWAGSSTAIQLACKQPLRREPGAQFIYSDINYILLGEIAQRVAGKPLEQYAQDHIFTPLRMCDTGYRPLQEDLSRVAPTDHTGPNQTLVRGTVHDPTARRMDGVAGHAGVFSTVGDLVRFARMLLNQGKLDGVQVLSPESVALLSRNQLPKELGNQRGYGMDIHTGYSSPRGNLYPVGSFGHTGFTGPTLWIDAESQSFYILLTNRNHPHLKSSVVPLRRKLGTLVAESVSPYKPKVLNGIDHLLRQNFKPLHKLKVGLITNHTGRDARSIATIDLLYESRNVDLRALFSPEHGIRGTLDVANIDNSIDPVTGLPVYSLYGKTRKPTPEQLAGLDALVFDIQDIGSRYYTYLSTMGNCMEAAAEQKKKFFVLDRINPIGGNVNGFLLEDKESFVRYHNIPIRHGMTAGELATMFNMEKHIHADLMVIPLQNWRREYFQDHTNLPWRNPSPNMRSLTQAILYPAVGMIEFCKVSVGRGTDAPFERLGAPWIHHLVLAQEFNALQLPGISALPIEFTPNSSKFAGQLCHGLNLHITDRSTFRPVDTGLSLAWLLQKLHPEDFDLEKANTLLGYSKILDQISEGVALEDLLKLIPQQEAAFQERQKPYLLYK